MFSLPHTEKQIQDWLRPPHPYLPLIGSGRKIQAGKGRKKHKHGRQHQHHQPVSSVNPTDHPGRFPEGDDSIDLAAINLAWGSDISGRAPFFDITYSHGAFPSFVFGGRSRPIGSEIALAGGPFEKLAKKFENAAYSAPLECHIVNFSIPRENPLAPQTALAHGGNCCAVSHSGHASLSSVDSLGHDNLCCDKLVAGRGGEVEVNLYGGFRRVTAILAHLSESNSNLKRIEGGFGGVALVRNNMQRSQSNQGLPSPQGNGNGNGAVMGQMAAPVPVNAGQQMDINMLYQKVLELSEVLRENREQTQGIVASAEELATRAAASGSSANIQEADREISASRIAALTRQNHELTKAKAVLQREQRENTKLIGEYETALGSIVEMVRDLAFKKDVERHASAGDYNQRLQKEKDDHLATRLERDNWHAEYIKVVGMLRHAYKLREEEEQQPVRIVSGLQTEVRGLRNALGLEPEIFEAETGYEVLKYVENGAGEQ